MLQFYLYFNVMLREISQKIELFQKYLVDLRESNLETLLNEDFKELFCESL